MNQDWVILLVIGLGCIAILAMMKAARDSKKQVKTARPSPSPVLVAEKVKSKPARWVDPDMYVDPEGNRFYLKGGNTLIMKEKGLYLAKGPSVTHPYMKIFEFWYCPHCNLYFFHPNYHHRDYDDSDLELCPKCGQKQDG